MRRFAALCLAIFAPLVAAQKPASTGNVSGRVFCTDTNAPARLAVVVLRPVPTSKAANLKGEDRSVEARRVQTLLDGSFSIPKVAAGTYLVLASMPGYITPLAVLGVSNEDLLEPTDDLRKTILDTVPIVTVEANGSASINISLERAAAVTGTVLYDDGSPAPGIGVQLQERKDGKWIPVHNVVGDGMGSGNSTTDDRGNFRITGLPPLKEAIAEAHLSAQNSTLSFSKGGFSTSGGPSFTLSFYSGGALRPNNAKTFKLTAGEERPGEDITIPLAKLHKVRGILVAKKDGHVLNKGSASLLFADDHTVLGKAETSEVSENLDFSFVPEGDYLLKVDSAADVRYDEVMNAPYSVPPTHSETITLREYGATEIPLRIDGDRSDVVIEVPEKQSPASSTGQQ